ncbi:MAG: TonB-dependent receptor plug domain-containing protein [Caldithrix sp.]|nr:TonB-dependent receptor plug domain-containing protein [Caldithrix sp.]
MKSSIHVKLFLMAFLSLLMSFNTLLADADGRVAGTIIDSETGDPLVGANIYLENTSLGAATDLEGNYAILHVPAGTYTLTVSVVGYAQTQVTDVRVNAGETTKITVTVKPEILTTETVVVEAKALKNTEAALLKSRQKALGISNAISAEAISRSGSGDAAEAMKKVTGASVVDGKYVYVRGLGERYTITQLNGAELPSSDPDKKSFQLDLIPSNLLDNIKTTKSFTPDKPGNFTGGAVDIGTKTFPEAFTMKISYGNSYNSQTSFQDNFIEYRGGDTDWLGFDDGTRKLPDALAQPKNIPLAAAARFDPEKAVELDKYSNAFNNIMNVQQDQVPVNSSLSLSLGDQISMGKGTSFGYLTSLTYDRKFSFYENGKVGRYRLNQTAETLNPQLVLSDSKGQKEATLGALTDFSFNLTPEQRIGFNIFYSHSGISTARYMTGSWPQEISDENRPVTNRVLRYIERDVQSYQLRGEHLISVLFDSKINWSASLAKTKQDEPDRRHLFNMTTQTNSDTFYTIVGSNFDDPARYWRFLDDQNNTYKIDWEIPFSNWSGKSSKFKFGYNRQEANRSFEERIFAWQVDNQVFNDVGGDPTALFDAQYNGIISVDSINNEPFRYNFGNTVYDFSKPKNNYSGDKVIVAYYAMTELPLFQGLKFVGGARFEQTEIEVKSEDENQEKGFVTNEDWLPSLNLIYSLSGNMNLRLAGSKTLARPNFRELAPYSTQEFVNDYFFRGNPGLKRTIISNLDLRWEWFTKPGEILAVSGFYKELNDPIELAFATGTTQSNPIVEYKNVPKARIMGAEFELRLGLGTLTPYLSNFMFGTNLSLVDSRVDISDSELAIRRGIDPEAEDTRSLAGQSDLIWNADLIYQNPTSGTTASLYFNYFSERLSVVSANITPDVFEQPAPQLDLILSQRIFDGVKAKFSVKNLLNSEYKELYNFSGKEYIYQSYTKGITYSLKLSYQI